MQSDASIPFTRAPRNILVRGVNWLGDAVMTAPAMHRLHEHWPESRITLLTPSKLVDLWRKHPHVHDIVSIEPGDSPWAVGRRLRGGSFDLALVLPNSPRSALEVYLGRVPRRVGYARPWRNWLLTDTIRPRPEETRMRKRTVAEIRALVASPRRAVPGAAFSYRAHHVFQYLRLIESLGARGDALAPRLHVGDDEVERVRRGLLGDVAPDLPCVGLNPGAEYGPAKRWPAERFAEAAIRIQEQTACVLLLFGGTGDAPITGQIKERILKRRAGAPVVDLAGRTSLRALACLLRHCRSVLTNDTGPMHLAAALGTPVVALFGGTSPELTGPGHPSRTGGKHEWLRAEAPCSPCFLRECPIDFRCMTGLHVDEAVDAVLRTLR